MEILGLLAAIFVCFILTCYFLTECTVGGRLKAMFCALIACSFMLGAIVSIFMLLSMLIDASVDPMIFPAP
jgi:hypothetical protein